MPANQTPLTYEDLSPDERHLVDVAVAAILAAHRAGDNRPGEEIALPIIVAGERNTRQWVS